MSKLDELIAELCPEGVEYKALEELGKFYGGLSGKSKEDFSDGNAKLISYMNIFSNLVINIDAVENVKIGENERQNTIQYGDVLFTGSSETPDECGMSSVLTTETEELLYLNSFCFGLRLNDKELLNPSFSKYLFRSEKVRKQIKRTASGVTRFNVSKKKMGQVTIPLPPLPVQQEIVRILDNFTELTAELTVELTAELTARKKQYEYYRNELLTFDDDVPMISLGETCSMKSGKSISSSKISTQKNERTQFACFGGNGIRGYVKDASHHGEFPIIGRQGALCGNVNYASGDFYATEHAVVVKSLGKYNQRFLFHLLTVMKLNQYKSQGAQPGLAVGNLENLLAPVPHLDAQQSIANILDHFDTLCNDLTLGIPAEIEARLKQYEYYRDKLLTFKEASE